MSEVSVHEPSQATQYESLASWARERTSEELQSFITRRHLALAAITVDE